MRTNRKRMPMRDNSKSLSVRMTEEQYQRLQRYRAMTRLFVSTYFRKLIAGEKFYTRPVAEDLNPHPAVNMIVSNVRQISRCRAAQELDADALAQLVFLSEKLCEETYLLVMQK